MAVADHLSSVSAVSFLVMLVSAIPARRYIDAYKKMLEREGGNPNKRVTFSQMKELNRQAYRKYLCYVLVWCVSTVIFVCSVLVMMQR